MDPLVPTTPTDTDPSRPPARWGGRLLFGLAAVALGLWVVPLVAASSMSLGTYGYVVWAVAVLAGMGSLVGLLVTSRRRAELGSPTGLLVVAATAACVAMAAHSALTAVEFYRTAVYVATVARMRDVAGAAAEQKAGTMEGLKGERPTRPWKSPSTQKPFAFDLKAAASRGTLTLDEGDEARYRSGWFRPLIVTGFRSAHEGKADPSDEEEVSLLMHEHFGKERSGPVEVKVGGS